MTCRYGTLTLNLKTPTVVHFAFQGESDLSPEPALQQTLQGTVEFELCGLVPATPGTLVLSLNGAETLAWDFDQSTCPSCGNTTS